VANLNAGYWNADIKLLWFRIGATPTALWDVYTIEPNRNEGTPHGHAGMAVGDIDRDGDLDLAYANGWYAADGDPTNLWTWHEITTFYGVSNVELEDMNHDGRLDLVMSAGHHGTGVHWYEAPPDATNGTWSVHVVDSNVVHPEGLAVLDYDHDVDPDVIASELFFGEAPGEPDWSEEVHNIYYYENLGGSTNWGETNIAPNSYPSHLFQVVDIDKDGNPDIISESAGHSVISYYHNQAPPVCPPTDIEFTQQVVDGVYPGNGRPGWSKAGDIDGDGVVDVVAGGGTALQWYKAPAMTRYAIESPTTTGGNGGLLLDVDGDEDLDVISALFNNNLAWWENPGTNGVTGTWTRHAIDTNVTTFNHDLAAGDIDGDGSVEIAALYVDGGIYWYDIPASPAAGAWPKTRVLATISDPFVGLALGDLDRDGDLDLVAANRWYERPATPTTPDWTSRVLFTGAVQNVMCYDVNRDGRLDVVAAEGFVHPAGRVMWAEAPIDPTSQLFTEHEIGTGLDGPENIWAGDLNSDGRTDIVSGAMGTSTGWDDNDSTLLLFSASTRSATGWVARTLASGVGVSARISPIDVDGDGDTDFTADGNAEDHIYLWVNSSVCSNITGTSGAASPVVFDPPPGLFHALTSVVLRTSTTGAVVRYTMDGSEPGSNSPIFASPIALTTTLTVRARAYHASLLPSSMSQATYTEQAPPGILAYWPMEEGTGLITTNDAQNAYHGALDGASWSATAISCATRSIEFDGINDRLNVGTIDVPGTAMTLCAWILIDDFEVGDARIMSKASGGIAVQDHCWMVSTDLAGGDRVLRFRLKTSGNTDTLIATNGILATGVWTHVAARYDGSTMALFKDGVNVGSQSKSGSITAGPSVPLTIGNHPIAAGDKPFDGLIDEVRIYNRALSDAELQILCLQSNGCHTPYVPYESWIRRWLPSHLTPSSYPWRNSDGDPHNNGLEFLADTRPFDGTHYLVVRGVTQSLEQVYVSFDASVDRVYSLETNGGIALIGWGDAGVLPTVSTGGLDHFEFPLPEEALYFRIKADLFP
jgi:hypothetical protein